MPAEPSPAGEPVTLRAARPEDAPVCGRICYDAFYKINTDHGFAPELPDPATAVGMLSATFAHPGFWCVVAEQNGRILGSNCLDQRGPVFGIGPITVDPAIQNHGVGRLLMQAVLDRYRQSHAPSVRLLQAAFHNRSLSLYTKLGFDAREPISLLQGPPLKYAIEGCPVRFATVDDLETASQVCERVHGHHRSGELRDAIAQGTARVVERHGRITGYVSAFGYAGHAVAESNLDLQALIAAAENLGRQGILVPTRNAELFRWCLAQGLRVLQPMTLMTIGLYHEPAGAYLPSILY